MPNSTDDAASGRPANDLAGPRVVAVVVAWNRHELLARCLDGLAAQNLCPDAVVVIDNASTDSSGQVAAEHRIVTEVVTMPENLGGAGGFAAGIAVACQRHHADLVWIMDDDTVPTPNALQALVDTRALARPVAVLASRADWHDGREHPMNTPRTRLDATASQTWKASELGCRPIRSASFVSIMLDAHEIARKGLPVADYFLWNDDFEYTARLLRDRTGLYVPASRVHHLTKTFGDSQADPGPRFYLEVRNKIWLFTRSPSLKAWEKAVYGASTLRRWIRTIASSRQRSVLVKGLVTGLRDGVMTAPRATPQVFADTPVAGDVAAMEAR